ncbi:MAG: type II toxin-antitoxin system HicB family antitoxin [Cyclobacteriaceae bacterium]|nr:type II toxin-antitoxin system HicB family antitoxin [Cyclobacteriaceae bacterium]
MERKYSFTAQIEKDEETGLYVGYIPNLPGAHSQGATLEELQKNLEEVALLCIEELPEKELNTYFSKYVGTQQILVEV